MAIGKVNAVRLIPSESRNKVTVHAQIICADEEGTEYVFSAASMVHDLKPYTDKQELSYHDWCMAARRIDRYRLVDWRNIDLEVDYRSGLTPQQTYEKHYESKSANR